MPIRLILKNLFLFFATITVIAVTYGSSGLLYAAGYPSKNIMISVHSKPGGGTDTMARVIAKHAERISGTHFIVENNPGAGGQMGYTKLATAKPDGYFVGAITTLSITTHELTRKGVVYSLKNSFRPIGRVVLDPSVVVVRTDSPYKTLDDLIKAAKKNPGKITWGGTFLFGTHHVHYIMFMRATGAKLQYIPFDGSADSRAALLGGHIDVGSAGASTYAQLVKEGKLRILAVGGGNRYPELPDAKTYKELGFDIQIGSNRGFAVPAGTPEKRAQWLDDLIGKVIQDPEFIKDAERVGIANTLSYLPGKEFASYLYQLQDLMKEILPKDKLVQ